MKRHIEQSKDERGGEVEVKKEPPSSALVKGDGLLEVTNKSKR